MENEYDLKSMKQRPKREADPEALKMSIHLRLDAIIVSDIKEKDEKMGLPYQTLINSVLKQYLNGELVSKETISIFKEILSKKDEVA